MFSFNKLPINRASRELRNTLKRQISKTSSAPNSDAVSRKDGQLGANADLKPFSNVRAASDKWTIHSKHNNSRALSTIQTKVLPNVSNAPFASKEESREFMAIFPDIVRDLTDAGRHTDIPEVTKRFAHVLQYNVPNGKKTRGLTTVIAYKMLEKPENLTPENIRLANILGWCVELLKAFGVVADDLIDHSETRHNMACWYKYEDVGMTAVNDSSLLEQSLFHILKKYLSNRSHYVSLIELFQDTTLKSAMGKSLDCEITNDLSKMTMKNYSLISKYRNGYCSLQLPVAAAMYLAGMSDPEQHRQAQTLLLEMGHYFQVQLQAYFIVSDDIMDNSISRRGRPCWYRNEGVGLIAINDGILLENSLYQLLKKHLSSLPCYVPIVELFHDITFKTSLGQSLDCLCLANGKPVLELFTMKRYNTIVKYKTSHYSIQLPVALGMYLANMTDAEQHRQAKTILLEIGEFFQIQDDFLDVFGDPEVTGKIGTDIRDGKCSWLAVVALQRATPAQRKVMEEHYGKDSDESVAIVKNLYEELGLPATYAVYEEESFNITRTHIQQISKGLPHELFFKILRKLYKRDC